MLKQGAINKEQIQSVFHELYRSTWVMNMLKQESVNKQIQFVFHDHPQVTPGQEHAETGRGKEGTGPARAPRTATGNTLHGSGTC
jgi:hypothetical protein